jgi:hypothetical protein
MKNCMQKVPQSTVSALNLSSYHQHYLIIILTGNTIHSQFPKQLKRATFSSKIWRQLILSFISTIAIGKTDHLSFWCCDKNNLSFMIYILP